MTERKVAPRLECVSLVIKDRGDSMLVWFPIVKSFVKIPKIKAISCAGSFYRLSTVNDNMSILCFQESDVSSIFDQDVNENKLFNVVLNSTQQTVESIPNVPVFIGNFVKKHRCYIGYHSYFGRIILPSFVSGDLKQFESYYCEIEFGKAKRMETCDCKWVVKNVMEKTTAPIMSPVNFIRARLTGMSPSNESYIFTAFDGHTTVNVLGSDIEDFVKDLIFVGMEAKLICEPPNIYGKPCLCCYATTNLAKQVACPTIPFYEVKPICDDSNKCVKFVEQILDSIGYEKLKSTFPSNVVELFEQWLRLSS